MLFDWDHVIALSRSFCRSLVSVSPPILLEILESSANRRSADYLIHIIQVHVVDEYDKEYWAKDQARNQQWSRGALDPLDRWVAPLEKNLKL